jgi:hypothetical protein
VRAGNENLNQDRRQSPAAQLKRRHPAGDALLFNNASGRHAPFHSRKVSLVAISVGFFAAGFATDSD